MSNKASEAGLGCLALILFFIVVAGLTALFWGWIIMLAIGLAYHQGWVEQTLSYRDSLPWGLILGIIAGAFSGSKTK